MSIANNGEAVQQAIVRNTFIPGRHLFHTLTSSENGLGLSDDLYYFLRLWLPCRLPSISVVRKPKTDLLCWIVVTINQNRILRLDFWGRGSAAFEIWNQETTTESMATARQGCMHARTYARMYVARSTASISGSAVEVFLWLPRQGRFIDLVMIQYTIPLSIHVTPLFFLFSTMTAEQ